ncbi:MAG: NAD-dependent deacylase [Thermogemmatispora sp.]|uniref:SIR2 family NAD-dependent protein deacylase n=1 Tax=Thermogemmatispora sp. TaxID=1968838 RepID=UPI001A0CF9D3|nr:NAD-dependent deacylase [Thermogemmatispora sp.]MBE3568221.1 NAD-dependent deacylase [Thermogemmatispora sp.]
MEQSIPHELCQALRQARRITALTGAGISAESGIPTFRDATSGLWTRFNPEELATREAFERNPRRVWEWYTERRQQAATAQPNAGHRALAAMEHYVEEVIIITQNVDGLHQRAGSSRVLELHGNLFRTKCFAQDHPTDPDIASEEEIPPRCPRCGSYLRPDVVWFGELLPERTYYQALQAVLSCDVLLVVGTSGIVEPAASLPHTALRAGATVVVINPEATPLLQEESNYGLKPSRLYDLRGKAGEILPALVSTVWQRTTDTEPLTHHGETG